MKIKQTFQITVFLTAMLFISSIAYRARSHKKTQQKEVIKHATIISESLWSFNPDIAKDYLQLASKVNSYKKMVVSYSSDEEFLSIDTLLDKPLDQFLESISVIPIVPLKAGIFHNEIPIGEIAVEWYDTSIYAYVYELFIIGLLLTVFRLFLGTLEHKQELEDRVRRRTADLEKEIEERRRTEETLRKSEERMRLFFERQITGLAITSPKKGWLQVNDTLCEMLGYTREELTRLTWAELTHPDDLAADNIQFKRLLSGETDGYIEDKRFLRKDGAVVYTSVSIGCVRRPDGEVEYVLAVLVDITDRKLAEEQLLQSQKMQSIGQLVSGVAHDFNNLLQVINGRAEMALLHLSDDHSPADDITKIAKAGELAKNLVQQLLTFSRQQVINPEDLDLNQEIESTKEMLGRLIGDHVQVEFMAGKNLGPVFADKGQINQVLMNLCVNAHDAMPDGGTLTIQTEAVQIKSADLKTKVWARPGNFVLLSVTDTGCGMEKAVAEKIFDPFFTTKEVGKGTGLGLSTVYGIVKQNEGHIEVQSAPGKGTTFRIYLPMSDSSREEPINKTAANTPPSKGGKEIILMAEDDEIILNLASAILSDAGYTILTAANGEEAVQQFIEHAEEIDLVMFDVMMPRMNGKKALEEIQQIRPSIRYLFVSGYSPESEVDEDSKHMLRKPYRASALLQKTREVLDTNRG
jgi:PAS domain S-box-containing protein